MHSLIVHAIFPCAGGFLKIILMRESKPFLHNTLLLIRAKNKWGNYNT